MHTEVVVEQEEIPEKIIDTEKKRNRAVGFALFAAAMGLALCRIGAYFLYDALEALNYDLWVTEYLLDVIFTVTSQIIVCFLIPFLIYKLYQKRTVKQVFLDANYSKVSWKILLCCVPLAIGCYLFTIYIMNYWLSMLIGFGYAYSPSSDLYPATFNPLLFLLSILLTAGLPAFCEEFLMRGNFLTSLRHNFQSFGVVILASIAFGLFHQNILQVVYTAVFGGLTAFLVVKTRSVFPAVIIHFVNNAVSVIMAYSSNYGWGLSDAMSSLMSQPFSLYLFLVLGLGLVAGFTYLILNIAKKEKREIPVLKLYKPSVRENAWHIGAITLASVSTVFTFVFGLVF